jgi:hypothetical protein
METKLSTRELALRLLDVSPWPAIEPSKAKVSAGPFGPWWERTCDTKAGRKALQEFDSIRGAEVRGDAATLWRIANACYFASTYDSRHDPGELYRKQVREARSKLGGMARAARVLKNGFGSGVPGVGWALVAACGELKMWAAFFGSLEMSLNGRLPELHGGPFFHRFTVANLHFNKPRTSGAPLKPETPLLFELTTELRHMSAGRPGHVWQTGAPMPSDGRPNYAVSCAFVKAALGVELTDAQAKSRLRSLPADVGRCRWPHEATPLRE